MNDRIIKPESKRIRVLLYSKYMLIRESLQILIESNKDFLVLAISDFSTKVEDLGLAERPDVAVVYFAGAGSVQIIDELNQQIPGVRVVAIINGKDIETQAAALKAGAVGIVQKEQSHKLLLEAIRQTYKGETWLNQVLLNKILVMDKSNGRSAVKAVSETEPDSLTSRELEVVTLIGQGLKNKNIAEELAISEATVRSHLSSIYSKLGVEDRLNLVIFASREGLIHLGGASR